MNDTVKGRGVVSSNAMAGMHSNPPRPQGAVRFATRGEIESAARHGVPVRIAKAVES